MIFDVDYALQILPDLLRAAVITLLATIGGFALAVVLGLVLAVLGKSRRAAVRVAVQFAIDFVRGTPLLIELFFVYYVLPVVGIVFDALPDSGSWSWACTTRPTWAEVYRAWDRRGPSRAVGGRACPQLRPSRHVGSKRSCPRRSRRSSRRSATT